MNQPTVTGSGLGLDRETVKVIRRVPASPSLSMASLIESTGVASSLTRVPMAWARARLAPDGLVSVRARVSSDSLTASPLTWTCIVPVVAPGARFSVPLAAE